ncbi:MAG: CHAT domain-containing tetratricopeptide repeat protein [Rhodomicrobium sp.]
MRGWPRRVAANVLLGALLPAATPMGTQAQRAMPVPADYSSDVAALSRRVAQLFSQGKYAEAIAIAQQALALAERTLGERHPDTLRILNNLASLYSSAGRYAEAEPLYKRVLEAKERTLGKEHPDTLRTTGNLALLYYDLGRYDEAEPLAKRTLEARERVLGKEAPETLDSINGLGLLYQIQGRHKEAEPLLRRAFSGREHLLGKEHPDTLLSLNNLALFYWSQGRYSEAEPLYKRALEASERLLGKEHPDTLGLVNNLALIYDEQSRLNEAAALYTRALEARERVLGPEHPDTLESVASLAVLNQKRGRFREAEALHKRALEARARTLGDTHPHTLASLNNLGSLYLAESDWVHAVQTWRRGTAAIGQRMQRSILDTGLTGKKESEAERGAGQFIGFVKAAFRLTPEGRTPDSALAGEMFQTAQMAQNSEAAQSLAQMAARGAKGDHKLAALARERQDLVTEWQKRDGLRNAFLGEAPDQRNPEAEAANAARLSAIDMSISEIDGKLKNQFPDFAALASPAPLAIAEVQALLGADEALILFLNTPAWKPTPEETFIWAVTKTDMRWVRSGLGMAALAREVQALRCGLDVEAWEDRPCEQLTGQSYTDEDRNAGKLLPFEHARAYKLYKALLSQVEDIIKGKSLLLVPSGALTQLPFQVLVTAPPADGANKSAAWLIREHALTVLPAVSSLKALRRVARPSTATKPMIGFGNPLLDGDQGNRVFGDYFKKRAELGRERQQCGKTASQGGALPSGPLRGVTLLAMRGGLADVSFIRFQVPLPETADELCAVASDVHADPDEIYLGARATEREVKRLSESGRLAQYRIVHFATHGALAGQVQGNAEPGLLLTPPAVPSEEDDGYLTASEIAGLKLDADWVILSACNTAAGGAEGAEALSGLARAFIYAQARALLVSHWEVDSNATVKLITGAMSRLAANKSMGRAEAMRQSMFALIDIGEPQEAHPAFWAPFVVVGEGAAARSP